MQRSSIFITITTIFLLAFGSILVAFLWLIDYDKQNYARELNNKYSNVAQTNIFYMSGIITEEKYKQSMQNVDMPEIKDEKTKDTILNKSTTIEEISDDLGTVAILLYKKNHYLKIVHLDEIKLLKDKEFQPYRYEVIKVIFWIISFILLLAYIFVIYKLKPLRKLKRQINKFAQNDLENIENVSSGNDEISDVAQAFYDAVLQIKTLNDSRHLFLRNIMHELKTPITKGRLVAEMMDHCKSKERFISIFDKLENLINELAAIEQTTSKIELENKTTCFVDDIIDEAIDIAMIEKDSVEIKENQNLKINVDFKLFSIAIKNMIDNGIKYSTDKKVQIIVNENNIKIISKGEKLKNDLNFFMQPFIKGYNSQKSFGLGLYIVNNILNSHKLNLNYEHKNGLNIFIFDNLKVIIRK
ncbi:ArsS family sensor histidine kinase [Campylobacter pinnipediorum]|uniref:histidine kinase n=1 Tax=Campylobacter pinnipediorum subsp. pinnipediorum TaxID=1660067 RepID=A0AAX0LC11_9BACT|nr:ArsS family sensor histidine kinase [Campylobacter pinnipediorum]AQW83133.1 two-component system sensor histidine kinase [Campylobacter pinnipediorum subsp. pinnipediorum]OPA81830.1 two-component sensor histidine kinase [Campylobacter pinnipediorum subsp. pinnipediorum]